MMEIQAGPPFHFNGVKIVKNGTKRGKKFKRSRMMFSLKLLILTQFTFCERPAIFGGEIIYLINISMPLNHPKVVLKS